MFGHEITSITELEKKVPPRGSSSWKTPMFEQYWRIKDTVEGILLFYRMGDFYELFGLDALMAAPILEVQLTARDKNADVPIPMCGIPFHAWESYAEKLLSRGLKIALCEQLTEPAKGSKLVERGIVRILTPGLPIDYQKLDQKESHWLLSLSVKDKSKRTFEVCVYDFLAGALFEGLVDGELDLRDLVSRINPKEVLVCESQWENVERLAGGIFSSQGPFYKRLTPVLGVRAREQLEDYLLFTQRCGREKVKKLLPVSRALQEISGSGDGVYAVVPSQVLAQWDVFPHLSGLLDRCGSAMGSRKLRMVLARPLKNAERIKLRQQAYLAMPHSKDLLLVAREVYDFERLLGRFRATAAHNKELYRIYASLKAMTEVLSLECFHVDLFKKFFAAEGLTDLRNKLVSAEKILKLFEKALRLDIDFQAAKENVSLIKEGFDEEFDRLRLLSEGAQQWLIDYEESLKKQTEISSLKVRYNRVFGFYIEVTKTHLAKVPDFFERKQTTVQGERFTTEVLRNKEAEILKASSAAEAKAESILDSLKAEVVSHDLDLLTFADFFSWVDLLASVRLSCTHLSRHGLWILPEVLEGPFTFEIRESRHPIIEDRVRGFVPNSLAMGDFRLLLLTGPNMAGKSTLMRQIGLSLLLAQCGFPVPATAMKFSPCDGFFSRMGASDKILDGESTFMVEMKEMSQILSQATQQSFILVDEIGRGTSSSDGLALAQALLEHLVSTVKPLAIFATHYHELAETAACFVGLKNASLSIEDNGGDIFFKRELVFQPAESSYGLHVAKMAGLPKAILNRADRLLKEQRSNGGIPHQQMSIFGLQATTPDRAPQESRAEKLLQDIISINLNDLSPKDAWLTLEKLQSEYPAD